mgnify:CR=1 FL=1
MTSFRLMYLVVSLDLSVGLSGVFIRKSLLARVFRSRTADFIRGKWSGPSEHNFGQKVGLTVDLRMLGLSLVTTMTAVAYLRLGLVDFNNVIIF